MAGSRSRVTSHMPFCRSDPRDQAEKTNPWLCAASRRKKAARAKAARARQGPGPRWRAEGRRASGCSATPPWPARCLLTLLACPTSTNPGRADRRQRRNAISSASTWPSPWQLHFCATWCPTPRWCCWNMGAGDWQNR
jgi:hypothetical protein